MGSSRWSKRNDDIKGELETCLVCVVLAQNKDGLNRLACVELISYLNGFSQYINSRIFNNNQRQKFNKNKKKTFFSVCSKRLNQSIGRYNRKKITRNRKSKEELVNRRRSNSKDDIRAWKNVIPWWNPNLIKDLFCVFLFVCSIRNKPKKSEVVNW